MKWEPLRTWLHNSAGEPEDLWLHCVGVFWGTCYIEQPFPDKGLAFSIRLLKSPWVQWASILGVYAATLSWIVEQHQGWIVRELQNVINESPVMEHMYLISKRMNNSGPAYLKELLIISNLSECFHQQSCPILEIPRVFIETFDKRAFEYATPHTWNSLHLYTSRSKSMTNF